MKALLVLLLLVGKPVPFGFKMAWLAIKGVPAEKVAAVVLPRSRRVEWAEGIKTVYDGWMEGVTFVSPAVDGWVFVVSGGLPDAGDTKHPDRITPVIIKLSEKLATTVQYFATHRVSEYHAWALADHGKLIRAYAYVGDEDHVSLDTGKPTTGEQQLKLPTHPSEEHVMQVAGKWSVDPTTLETRKSDPGPGWLGRLSL